MELKGRKRIVMSFMQLKLGCWVYDWYAFLCHDYRAVVPLEKTLSDDFYLRILASGNLMEVNHN